MTFGDLSSQPFERIGMTNVYIEHSSMQYKSMFKKLGFNVVVDVDAADLVCFTGGSDVTPDLYGEPNLASYNDVYRDEKEKRLFEFCLENKIPMVGICRGGQFLNVMSGGKMYQDVTNHGGSHYLVDEETGETVYVSSTHHQMMLPNDESAIIIAKSRGVRSHREWYFNNIRKRDENDEGIEVVYYTHTNCLCFQPHPEFDGYPGMTNYFRSLLNRCFDV